MRQTSWIVAGFVAVATLLSAGPALAKSPYPPPSKGSATITPSRIQAGQCAVFSGTGFAPGATIAITDNGASVGSTTADPSGDFSTQVCESSDAKRGNHAISGTGRAPDGSTLTETATLTVTGVHQSASSTNTGSQASSSGPQGSSTGSHVTTTSAAAATGATGPTTGVIAAVPPAGGVESQVPAAGTDSGSRLLAYGLSGLGFAFLASLLILLLERRRRREDPTAAPA